MEVFKSLKKATSVEDLTVVGRRMATHLDALEEESFDHEFPEIDLARAIAASYRKLLAQAASFDAGPPGNRARRYRVLHPHR